MHQAIVPWYHTQHAKVNPEFSDDKSAGSGLHWGPIALFPLCPSEHWRKHEAGEGGVGEGARLIDILPHALSTLLYLLAFTPGCNV